MQHTLTLEPRLLVLLLPDALCHRNPPQGYGLVHHDEDISRSLAFVLQGTRLEKRQWLQVLVREQHLIILQRRSTIDDTEACPSTPPSESPPLTEPFVAEPSPEPRPAACCHHVADCRAARGLAKRLECRRVAGGHESVRSRESDRKDSSAVGNDGVGGWDFNREDASSRGACARPE